MDVEQKRGNCLYVFILKLSIWIHILFHFHIEIKNNSIKDKTKGTLDAYILLIIYVITIPIKVTLK